MVLYLSLYRELVYSSGATLILFRWWIILNKYDKQVQITHE